MIVDGFVHVFVLLAGVISVLKKKYSDYAYNQSFIYTYVKLFNELFVTFAKFCDLKKGFGHKFLKFDRKWKSFQKSSKKADCRFTDVPSQT